MTYRINGNINVLMLRLKRKLKLILHKAGEDLLNKTRPRVPIDTGELRASGKVRTKQVGNKTTTTVSYNTPYALIQHETFGFRHPRGGEAKYLEYTLKDSEQEIFNFIKSEVLDFIRRS